MNYVKALKFVVVGIIMAICLALPGEMFQLYLSNFDSGYYHTSFYLPKDVSQDEMNEEILSTAKKYDVMIMQIKKTTVNLMKTEIDIYADEETSDYIRKNYYIKSGTYNSFFAGETIVEVYDFNDSSSNINGEEYALLGDEENLVNYKLELIEKYFGSIPKCSGADARTQYQRTYIAVWIMVILLCCLVTVYECASLKKESFIRLTLGENIKYYIFKNILIDSLFFVGLFTVLKIICRIFTGTGFLWQFSYIGMLPFIALNSLTYLKLKPKSVASLTGVEKSSKKLLVGNYLIKSVCVILTCIVISTNIACIFECVNYYRQKSFFEEYNEYYNYNRFSLEDDQITDEVEEELYNEFVDEMNIFCLCNRFRIGNKTAAFANINTKDYLIDCIDGFGKLDFSRKAYILINKREKLSEEELQSIIGFTYTDDYEVFYYKSNAEVVIRELDSDPETTLVKNPIIIFQNNYDEGADQLFLCMMKTDKTKLEAFARKNNLSYTETNMLDYFNQRLHTLKRLLYLNTIMSVIIILIEVIVTATVVRMEYSVNAVSLALKKVLGYSNKERFSSLYKIIISLWVISTAAAIAMSYFLNFGNYVYVAVGSILILVFDLVIIEFNIRNYDRKNIQKILKGGAL